jgi:hypothetical protein
VIIKNTDFEAQHPWPEGMLVQGGESGIVLRQDAPNYTTAFVEAFPNTFLRGEGKTLAEAEDKVWAQYERLISCPTYPTHGPFERRHYRNGAGYCTSCGGWFTASVTGFEELPPEPNAPKSSVQILFEHAMDGNTEEVAKELLDANIADEETVAKLVKAMETKDYEAFKKLLMGN